MAGARVATHFAQDRHDVAHKAHVIVGLLTADLDGDLQGLIAERDFQLSTAVGHGTNQARFGYFHQIRGCFDFGDASDIDLVSVAEIAVQNKLRVIKGRFHLQGRGPSFDLRDWRAGRQFFLGATERSYAQGCPSGGDDHQAKSVGIRIHDFISDSNRVARPSQSLRACHPTTHQLIQVRATCRPVARLRRRSTARGQTP